VDDFVKVWNELHVQGVLIPGVEHEVMLDLTIPISSESNLYRVGWSLRRSRDRRLLALSTGQAKWTRDNPNRTAQHVSYLLEACDALVVPPPRYNRH